MSILEAKIDPLATVAAVVISNAISSIWYGPFLGPQWQKYGKWSKEEIEQKMNQPKGKKILISIIQQAIIVVCLALVFHYLNAQRLSEVLTATFWIWVAFVAIISLDSVLWNGNNIQFFLINALNKLVSLLASAFVYYVMSH